MILLKLLIQWTTFWFLHFLNDFHPTSTIHIRRCAFDAERKSVRRCHDRRGSARCETTNAHALSSHSWKDWAAGGVEPKHGYSLAHCCTIALWTQSFSARFDQYKGYRLIIVHFLCQTYFFIHFYQNALIDSSLKQKFRGIRILNVFDLIFSICSKISNFWYTGVSLHGKLIGVLRFLKKHLVFLKLLIFAFFGHFTATFLAAASVFRPEKRFRQQILVVKGVNRAGPVQKARGQLNSYVKKLLYTVVCIKMRPPPKFKFSRCYRWVRQILYSPMNSATQTTLFRSWFL